LRKLTVHRHEWRLKQPFIIARGSRTSQDTVEVVLTDGVHQGRGGCSPIRYHNETIETLLADIESCRQALESGADRRALQALLPPGAARAALDAALWDLEASQSGQSVSACAGLPAPKPVTTAYTISLDTPDAMARQAKANAHRPLLKVKLGSAEGLSQDIACAQVVRAAAPLATCVADINAAWKPGDVAAGHEALADLGFALLEQPLPVGQDAVLASFAHRIPLCADESCNTRADLPSLTGLYDAINIKLEKAGGLTEALALKAAAQAAGLRIFVGCMLGSSLGTAPAVLLAQGADWVDLDGPLLLAEDDDPPLAINGSLIAPPNPPLWFG
jgi:L-Ala-D/L-Glu epimerase